MSHPVWHAVQKIAKSFGNWLQWYLRLSCERDVANDNEISDFSAFWTSAILDQCHVLSSDLVIKPVFPSINCQFHQEACVPMSVGTDLRRTKGQRSGQEKSNPQWRCTRITAVCFLTKGRGTHHSSSWNNTGNDVRRFSTAQYGLLLTVNCLCS